MKVRDLIRALVKHDLDLDVVISADRDLPADFRPVGGVDQGVFTADLQEPDNLVLADLDDMGAFVAVRLSTRPPLAH